MQQPTRVHGRLAGETVAGRDSRLNVLYAAVLILAVPGAAPAAEFSPYFALTTDYVWRGVSQSDGHAAVQLGLDANFDAGYYLGAWVSSVDIDQSPRNRRDTELAYYAGYSTDIGKRWSLGARAVAFTYPGQQGAVDYDYEEYSVTANYDDMFWLEYAYSPALYASNEESHNVEVYGELGLPMGLVLGAGAGRYDAAAAFGDHYHYWQLGLTRSIGPIDVDLRFHDTDDYVLVVSSRNRSEPRVVFTLRALF
ncbi:MAG: TorF family putative porin [Pseudomonadota bacterium]